MANTGVQTCGNIWIKFDASPTKLEASGTVSMGLLTAALHFIQAGSLEGEYATPEVSPVGAYWS